jgi:hypothetical protein
MRGQILAFVVLGHVGVIRRCDMIFWEFYGRWRIRRAFCESKECKIWTFIVGVMVIRRILFYLKAVRAVQKTSSNIFLKNKRKLCHIR